MTYLDSLIIIYYLNYVKYTVSNKYLNNTTIALLVCERYCCINKISTLTITARVYRFL